MPELFDYDLDRVFLPDQPVRIQYVENGKSTADKFLEFLKREFPGTQWQVERVPVLESASSDVQMIASRMMPPISMRADTASNLDQLMSYVGRAARYDLDVPEPELKDFILKLKPLTQKKRLFVKSSG